MVKKILVVDDELDIVKALTVRLKANNYDVIGACDGTQAIGKAHKEKPDLILMDIKMPGQGGIKAYEHLKVSSDTSLIPVIFVTAIANEETRQQILEMGAVDFIAKPFDSRDVLAKVKKALGEM
jgi:DNA-binding response OmpR family regulator